MSKIINQFNQTCRQKAEEIAFYYYDKPDVKSKTFAEVQQDLQKATQHLLDQGVQSGDRLLAFARPNYNLTIFILAAFQLGAAVMYVDIWAKQDTLARLFRRCQPKFLLVSNQTKLLRFAFREISKISQAINIDRLANLTDINSAPKLPDVVDTQPALLTTTTGSTATPKIVVRSHADLLAQLELIQHNITASTARTVALTTSYIYVFANLLQGFTTVLPNINLRKSSKVLNRKLAVFRDLNINMIITSPDFCLKTQNIYPKLEHLYFGGAILNYFEAGTILQKFRVGKNPAKITYIYGCSECNLITTTPLSQYFHDLQNQGISNLGQPVRGVQVKIGLHDEILVKSNARTDHYLDEDKHKSLEFYDTSDRGYLDGKNLIYLGKANAVLRASSKPLYSAEVEQAVSLQFKLAKCAILEYKNQIYLFLQKPDSYNQTKILEFIQDKFQITPIIKRIRKIPCDIKHHTKVDYQKLKQGLK